MNLTITANTPQELKEKLVELAVIFGYNPAQQELPFPKPTEPKAEQQPEPAKEEKKTRTRKAKADEPSKSEPQAPAETPAQDTDLFGEADTKAETKKATKEDAIAALKKVNEEKGIEVARAVLSEFDCSRVSELKEEHFAEFVEACQVALAS